MCSGGQLGPWGVRSNGTGGRQAVDDDWQDAERAARVDAEGARCVCSRARRWDLDWTRWRSSRPVLASAVPIPSRISKRAFQSWDLGVVALELISAELRHEREPRSYPVRFRTAESSSKRSTSHSSCTSTFRCKPARRKSGGATEVCGKAHAHGIRAYGERATRPLDDDEQNI